MDGPAAAAACARVVRVLIVVVNNGDDEPHYHDSHDKRENADSFGSCRDGLLTLNFLRVPPATLLCPDSPSLHDARSFDLV